MTREYLNDAGEQVSFPYRSPVSGVKIPSKSWLETNDPKPHGLTPVNATRRPEYDAVFQYVKPDGAGGWEIIELPDSEKVKNIEGEISHYVNGVAQAKGYDNIDSIAKYLGSDNAFRAECEALSAWTADVWVTAQGMLNDWQAGTIEQPTVDDVIAALPTAPA